MNRLPQEPEKEGSTSDWMTTYSDMVTLLFTFFVLLFAISQIDVQKFNLLAASLSNKGATPEQIMELGLQHNLKNEEEINVDDPRIPLPVGEGEINPMQEAYDSIQNHVDLRGLGDKVKVSLGDDYVFIRFVDDMLFEPNSARIRQQDYVLLEFIGKSLLSVQDDAGMIRVDGHTAAVPERSDYPVSDRDLSSERANSVLKYFENDIKIRGDKLAAFSFGKYRPIGDNNTEEGRRKNRRIEILVTQANDVKTQLDNIYEKMVD